MSDNHDLEHILSIATQIAREAGAILRAGFTQIEHAGPALHEPLGRDALQVDYKGDIEPVTEYDHKSETHIVARLRRTFSAHEMVGEEGDTYDSADVVETSWARFRWQVDPLDDTVNFAHGVSAQHTAARLKASIGKRQSGFGCS